MGSEPANPDLTRMLAAAQSGDRAAAERLLPLVYDELRRMAEYLLKRKKPGMTLQATALVHEAYMRLAGSESPGWESRRHFFNAAALAMRRVLADRARYYSREKHRPKGRRMELDGLEIPATQEFTAEQWEALESALAELNAHNERWCEIVNLRFFIGLTNDQTAEVLGISVATVKGDWTFAKAWLKQKVHRAARA